MQQIPNGDSELQQKAFVFFFVLFLRGEKNIKGEERFILKRKKIKLFLALCRVSAVGKKVQPGSVPEPNTCFWDGFLPQQSFGQISDSTWHQPSSALAGSGGRCWSQERHFKPVAWDPRVPAPLLRLSKPGFSCPARRRPKCIDICIKKLQNYVLFNTSLLITNVHMYMSTSTC